SQHIEIAVEASANLACPELTPTLLEMFCATSKVVPASVELTRKMSDFVSPCGMSLQVKYTRFPLPTTEGSVDLEVLLERFSITPKLAPESVEWTNDISSFPVTLSLQAIQTLRPSALRVTAVEMPFV